MSPSGFQRSRSSSGVLPLHNFVFSLSNLMLCFGNKKEALWARHRPIRSRTQRQASSVSGRGRSGQETYLLLSEISKASLKRHSINYSPSLHHSVSVRLQSRHDRASNSMFTAKKYGPLWCESRLQGNSNNGYNSSGENTAYFMRHSPGRKDKVITSLHDTDGYFFFQT